MARSLAQRTQLLALPTILSEFEEFYTLPPTGREFVAARRTAINRLAVQLCILRHPRRAWIPKEALPMGMLRYIASQIEVTANNFQAYADRDETRRKHLTDLLVELALRTLGDDDHRWPKDAGLGGQETASPGCQPAGRPYPNEFLAYNFQPLEIQPLEHLPVSYHDTISGHHHVVADCQCFGDGSLAIGMAFTATGARGKNVAPARRSSDR